MSWGFRCVCLGMLLSLTGCALNESVVQASNQSGSSKEEDIASNKLAMFVFPQPELGGTDSAKGYFVEFEISENSESSVLQYRD